MARRFFGAGLLGLGAAIGCAGTSPDGLFQSGNGTGSTGGMLPSISGSMTTLGGGTADPSAEPTPGTSPSNSNVPTPTPTPTPNGCANGAECRDFFKDQDADGFGTEKRCLCAAEGAFTALQGADCNDTLASVHPNAEEACNGVDDNCSAGIDEQAMCPCQHETFQGHSYLFCDKHETWLAAAAHCKATGYHLITINDAAENEWVTATARKISDTDWWMGLNDQLKEGIFVWLDGSPVTYTNWNTQTGEPNNGAGEPGGEQCGRFNRFSPLTSWDDAGCMEHFAYACAAP